MNARRQTCLHLFVFFQVSLHSSLPAHNTSLPSQLISITVTSPRQCHSLRSICPIMFPVASFSTCSTQIECCRWNCYKTTLIFLVVHPVKQATIPSNLCLSCRFLRISFTPQNTVKYLFTCTHYCSKSGKGKWRKSRCEMVKMVFKLRGLLPVPGNVSLSKRD